VCIKVVAKDVIINHEFTQMGTDKIIHQEITEKIIKGFYKVYSTLGHGFLEKVYENAFAIELRKLGLRAE